MTSRSLLNYCWAFTWLWRNNSNTFSLQHRKQLSLSLMLTRTHANRHLVEYHSHEYSFKRRSMQRQMYFFSPCSRTDLLDLCVTEHRKSSLSPPRSLCLYSSSAMMLYGSFPFPSPDGIKWKSILIASILSSVPTPLGGGVESLNLILLRIFQNEWVES